LLKAIARYDGARLKRSQISVPPAAGMRAWRKLAARQRRALRVAWENIIRFHRRQTGGDYVMRTRYGRFWHLVLPLGRVGINVSAGEVPLVSTLLMCAGAARAAGVKNLAVMSPPRSKGRVAPVILAAAHLAGIKEIYAMGGAHGVAALVYGTESVSKVDKVVGPGGLYTQAAKQITQGTSGLEGPSEILVLADATADPAMIAADLVAQAEHAGDNWPILVTPSRQLAKRILTEIMRQLDGLPRARQAARSFVRYGTIVLVRSMREGLKVADEFGPEHLSICSRNASALAKAARCAGTILIGGASPAAAADFGAGPNHVLPTAGTARYASGLGVKDFVRHVNVTCITPGGLRLLGPSLAVIARMEGLEGHARSLEMKRG
jgi:histidinol dehydrogenase